MMEERSGRTEISARVRELRESSGMQAAEAAGKLGIERAAYEEYEAGLVDAPISFLYAVAGLFGVDMTDLMTGKSPNLQQYCVVREGEGPEIERYPGYRFQSLAFDFQNRLFEPLLVSLDPEKNSSISPVRHGGQEFNLVLSGRVRVVLGGKAVDLGKGDSIFFDPSIPHGQLALDDDPATFLTVIMRERADAPHGAAKGGAPC